MRVKTKFSFAITAVLLACLAPVANAGFDTGLVAYYCFNDATNLGKDCSVNGNHGKAEGTVTAVTGYRGKGAMFGGIDNPADIHVPNSDSLKFTSALSISYAVKLNSLTGMSGGAGISSQTILAKSHEGTGFMVSALNYDYAPGVINMLFGNKNANATNPLSAWHDSISSVWSTPSVGKWVQVVFTVDTITGIAKTYHDGLLVNTQQMTIDFTLANQEDLYIGKYSDDYYPLKGVIDEVRLYNRVLTASEAKLLYLQGATVSGIVRDLGNYSVSCTNNNTGQIVNIAASTATNYDCEAKGLKAKVGENVTITINGNKQ